MFISIERYIGVTRPLRYPIIITHRRTIVAILVAWLIAMLVSIGPFLGWNNEVKATDQICLVNDNLTYVLFSCSVSFYIPLIIILCVYGRIYGEAIRQYRFLSGGEKKVHLKELVGQECVTLRIHIPQHISASTTSISNGYSSNSAISFNGKRVSTQMTPSGSNKLSKFKRERRAGKIKIKKNSPIKLSIFPFSEDLRHRCWDVYFMLVTIFSSITNK
jgi:adrenergic receptor alpha-1D